MDFTMKLITRDRSFYRSLIVLGISVALQKVVPVAVSFGDNLRVGSL